MIPEKIKFIMQELLNNGFEAYIIGGAVRDKLLHIEPHDYDIFTDATGEEILKIFPTGKVLGGEERQQKILTVMVDDVEVSQYRSNGDRTETGTYLEDHQATCDLTINAMAMDIDGKIHWNNEMNCRGMDDLNVNDYEGQFPYQPHPTLRFVGSPLDRLDEDNLRALRVIRFKCKYKSTVDYASTLALKEYDISKLPVERIREELLKIMQYENGLKELNYYGLLKQIIPELYHENHFKSGGDHHDETPFIHMMNAFSESCKVTDNVLLRMACLLHDIGKGEARTESNAHEVTGWSKETHEPILKQTQNDINFYHHETIGCDIARNILIRLKFSKEDTEYVCYLIRKHMFSYKDKQKIKKKTYVKFFKGLDDHHIPIMDYIIQIYSDYMGNEKKKGIKFGDFISGSWLLGHYWECKYDKDTPFTIKDLDISGRDIISLGIKPGPMVGTILSKAFTRVMDGELKNNRPDLMAWLKDEVKK